MIDLGMREFMEPQGGFLFVLEVDKRWVAHFNECSGLKNSTEVVELREGLILIRPELNVVAAANNAEA